MSSAFFLFSASKYSSTNCLYEWAEWFHFTLTRSNTFTNEGFILENHWCVGPWTGDFLPAGALSSLRWTSFYHLNSSRCVHVTAPSTGHRHSDRSKAGSREGGGRDGWMGRQNFWYAVFFQPWPQTFLNLTTWICHHGDKGPLSLMKYSMLP